MLFNPKTWLKFSIINLLIVALLGMLMRYKMGFEFSYFNQTNLLHSHSHFAFAGWISHTLMVLMVLFLEKKGSLKKEKKSINYNYILTANLICSYGMLMAFIVQGYAMVSIFFSTMSIIVSYVFCYQFWKDLKFVAKENLSVHWFKGALFFNVISSIGTFSLAYMMANKNVYQNEFLASIYYYLHFQYNGWFFFACMGLLIALFNIKGTKKTFYAKSFWLFFFACIPAYFLSILWLKLPLWIYVLTVLAALAQVYGCFRLLYLFYKSKVFVIKNYPTLLRSILFFIMFAFSLKIVLQLGSVIPSLGQLAFGFRPIIIAYLHLILLAVISQFLLFYIFSQDFFKFTFNIKIGLALFAFGVFLNELFLMLQSITAFSNIFIPIMNELLFGAALIMVLGLSLVVFGIIKKNVLYDPNHNIKY
ncbi:hypothetical protein [Flavobacterium sp.]|uniref:hypothetical protein n=1 Tax=Flavobacterium sp. TaxID=239 RepID=UPI002623E486|nr:hypothetical protein [Flavobacterium sp.]MDD3005282.1 hypothetical protein [Flavobacterium sp.]